MEMIYTGKHELLPRVNADGTDPEIIKFNQVAHQFGVAPIKVHEMLPITQEEFDRQCQADWKMPVEYQQLDIEQWVLDQLAPWDDGLDRAQEELLEFKKRNMLNLLRWMKYFVDTCRANGVVWGVGRGSSVASYVLYLIGVHKIDSVKYDLPLNEFFK